jgi:hypothetical protein
MNLSKGEIPIAFILRYVNIVRKQGEIVRATVELKEGIFIMGSSKKDVEWLITNVGDVLS